MLNSPSAACPPIELNVAMRVAGPIKGSRKLPGLDPNLRFMAGWIPQVLVAYFAPLILMLLLAVGIDEPDGILWDVLNYVFFFV